MTKSLTQHAVELNRNAGWCWFQDDRVLVDHDRGQVLFTSVANRSGTDGERRNGDIDVTTFRPPDGPATTVTLGNVPTLELGDDHNAAALWLRPDGRYLAMFTGHLYGRGINLDPDGRTDTTPDSFYRISESPGDAVNWGPTRRFTWPSNDPTACENNDVTYSNLIHLAEEGGENGRLYNFARAAGRTMHIATSDDLGETWTYGGILSLPPSGGRNYSNGYFKFVGNGRSRIDFLATEAHPRDFNNSIYHGYIEDGRSHDASGKVIDDDLFSLNAPPPEAFTQVFAAEPVGSGAYHHAWPTSLVRGGDGNLHALFTTRYGEARAENFSHTAPGDADHRLFYGEFDGSVWRVEELARMGPGLHDDQQDYTGLGAIDLRRGRAVYISTNVDPRNRTELSRHALFRGDFQTSTGEWTWTPLDESSEEDDLRPLLAVFDSETAVLLWLRGPYPHQRDYNQIAMARMV